MARARAAWARVGLFRLSISLLAVGVGGWLAASSVEAASVKSLQSGVTAVPSSTAVAVTLSPSVDATKAFVVCSARTTSSRSNRRVTCVLTNTTLTIDGGTNVSSTVTVSWYVAEFEGGVTVQRATATFNAGSTTPSAAPSLTAVDCTKSFVVLAGEQTNAANATNNDQQFTFRAILGTAATPCTSGTSSTLTLTRTTTTASAATVAWQVVTYEGASVQRGVVTILQAATTATATLGTAVDTSKSFILMSRQAGSAVAGVEAEYQARAAFTTTGSAVTGLTFTRSVANNTANHQVDLSWQVVSLSDGSTVQTGSTVGTGTHTTMSTTGLSTMDLTRTVPFFTASGGTAGTAIQLDETSWTVALAATSITFTRGASATLLSTAAWFTVSFFKCAAVSDASFVVANGQSGQATVYWPSSTALIGRKTAAFVSTDVPVHGTTYAVNDPIGTATVVDNQSAAASSFNQTGLDTSGATTYYYKVFPKTVSTGPCYAPGTAPGVEVDVTPAGVAGSPNWSYATGATTLVPPGLSPNDVVVTGSNGNKLHGANASDGTLGLTNGPFGTGMAIQSRPLVIPFDFRTPVTAVDVVYMASQDGFAYAVDANTGTQVWQSAALGNTLQGGTAAWLQFVKSLTIGGANVDAVFIGTRNTGGGSTTNNKVYALNGDTGATLWTFNPGNMDIINSTPYVDYNANTVWVTSLSNGATQPSVWKLNAATGALISSVSLGDVSSSPSPSLDASFLYVGIDAGDLKAIRLSDNAVFTYTPATGAGAIKGFPLPLGGSPEIVVFSRDTTVHRVDFNLSTGSFTPVWAVTLTGTPTVSTPIDDGGTNIYVGASDKKIHRLALANGADGAQRTIPGPGTPTVGDPSFDTIVVPNQVYVGATDGHIYSFDAF